MTVKKPRFFFFGVKHNNLRGLRNPCPPHTLTSPPPPPQAATSSAAGCPAALIPPLRLCA